MKIVIAPDSFKESLSAPEAAEAIARGWRQVFPYAEILLRPMADGGEGTVAAVLAATGGEQRELHVSGPLGEPVTAHWGWLGQARAVIEMAASSGLHWVPRARRNALQACSFGTGQVLRAALDAGARQITLGLGGSATNDGGSGLLRALGVRFLDRNGKELAPGGLALAELADIDLQGLDSRLQDVQIQVAADVDNPLCGPRGASHIFGPQKGASPEDVLRLDAALQHYADCVARVLGDDFSQHPGVGAAGGMGFALKAFLGASFRPGVELVAQVNGLADAIQGASLVITGEGCLDAQTLYGKTPIGVARVAAAAGVPVIALAGTLGEGYAQLYEHGIEAAFSLVAGPCSLEQACTDAARQLQARSVDLARLWRLGATSA